MKKEKIKNIILVVIVAIISGSLSSILTTNTISGNKLLGSVSHSDYLDSSNVTYSNSNVQDTIDSLYACASNYSEINTRLSKAEKQIGIEDNIAPYLLQTIDGVKKKITISTRW